MALTIKDILNRAATESANRPALHFKREGVWCTYSFKDLRERAWQVAEMCDTLGVKPEDRVALYRENSPEWYEIYFGIVSLGAIAVPVDVKLREQEIGHIFHDCGVSVVFLTAKNIAVLEELKDKLPELRAAIVLDVKSGEIPDSSRIEYHDYREMQEQVSPMAFSVARAFDRHDPLPDDPASFIYTSGTTGRQKGAILTHRNFISNVISCQKAIKVYKEDNFLLVLPLHHSFAFTTTLLLPVLVQCQVSLVENLKTIKSNMKETSPTVLLAVPLLLEKMMARIMENIRKKKIAVFLYKFGFARLIGKRIHKELGGALRLIVSGGAPIDPDTLRSWNKLGFKIVEGYGITETAPVLTLNPPEKPRIGTVGLPLPDVEIKIVNPDANGVGEIAIRGPNVMKGYFNNPDATAECLREGWFYSGDIGYFDEEGYLVINGRKKSLIVNREGKNIYPEEVEQHISKSPYILECLALGYREPGETTGERVGLIVVPDQEAFDALENEENKRFTEKEIEEFVKKEVKRLAKEISEYKRPRCIQVRFEEFEKTTTAKIKRYLYAIDTSGM